MKDKENKRLVPKLRFSEFEGEWGQKTLDEITLELIDGDWIESKDQSNEGIRFLQTGNIGVGEFIPKNKNARYISIDTFNRLNCTEVFPGDCLVSRLPDPIGRSSFIPDTGQRMITALDCLIVRFDELQIIPYLFMLYTQTHDYLSEVEAKSSGSTRKRISRKSLSKIKIPLTVLPEQKK